MGPFRAFYPSGSLSPPGTFLGVRGLPFPSVIFYSCGAPLTGIKNMKSSFVIFFFKGLTYDKRLISQIGEGPISLIPWAMGVPGGPTVGWREVCTVGKGADRGVGDCGCTGVGALLLCLPKTLIFSTLVFTSWCPPATSCLILVSETVLGGYSSGMRSREQELPGPGSLFWDALTLGTPDPSPRSPRSVHQVLPDQRPDPSLYE